MTGTDWLVAGVILVVAVNVIIFGLIQDAHEIEDEEPYGDYADYPTQGRQ